MKKTFTVLAAVLLTAMVWAQSPQKMSYQAVIRNSNDQLVTTTQIGMEINIRQGTPSGTVVYSETQTPTTNANGLVSIEIGGGAGFNTINWANGPYFIEIKTAIVPPLTTYTITGTSQLLSVPYALHAKTAESVTGTIIETDPTFTSSQAANIDATDITNLGNLSGVNTGDQDISGIATNTQAIQDTASQIRADIPDVTTYSIGDYAQGGVVFYVDETGQHGLVCAITDQDGGSGIRWHASTNGNTNARGDGLYAGETNTAIIIAAQVAIGDDGNTYAARICNELQVTQNIVTYGDWYLPSKYELNLMYTNKSTINATATANSGSSFASAAYWSSTEYDYFDAWLQSFANGIQAYDFKNAPTKVRAVRAF
ncbi:MAG: hypothetical protein CVU11_15820 [Bacteroidetes bacterium HGW-Bacteroidetes-6]|jgi:hypothetical protein|nr:MAG: hypothetical protein CVU11_15820 [Bacteroidetes bacterium HGW-Bacteroidetes-6]